MRTLTDALRLGAVRFPRGTLRRKACIGSIKILHRRPRLPPGLTEVRPLDRPHVSFEPTDSMVMDAIYWFGVQGYEGRMADVWESLCATAHNIIEVGANVGLFTVLGGLCARGSYTAVEPLPEVADVLRRNLARNRLSAAIDVRQAAAVANPSDTPVEISIPNEGRSAPVGAHLTLGTEVTGRSSFRTISVPSIAFANLIERATLIKIDAEGIEAELLQSALGCVAQNKPTIVIEVLPNSSKLAALISHIASKYGYTIHVIPAYGSDEIVVVRHEEFGPRTPWQRNSKDVVLAQRSLF